MSDQHDHEDANEEVEDLRNELREARAEIKALEKNLEDLEDELRREGEERVEAYELAIVRIAIALRRQGVITTGKAATLDIDTLADLIEDSFVLVPGVHA